jgi:hypothetical protein
LRAGDILLNVNGQEVVVEQVQHEILENPITVYNFEVADYHTYFVAQNINAPIQEFVLVHNDCSFKTFDKNGLKNNFGIDDIHQTKREILRAIDPKKLKIVGNNPDIALSMGGEIKLISKIYKGKSLLTGLNIFNFIPKG